MKIIFSDHLKVRMKLREIPEVIVRKIYLEADEKLYDTETSNLVAIKKILFQGRDKDMAVIYKEFGDEVLLYTVHPLKSGQKENRINKGRWKIK